LDQKKLIPDYINALTMKNQKCLTGTITKVCVLCVLFITVGVSQTHAQGDLLITPRRVVFEGNREKQEITLANTGTDTARYEISFVQYRMNTDGSFEIISEPDSGQYFADSFIRYFPRSVVLGPRESQVLRMQLRKTPDMAKGEYRSHLYFRAVPLQKPLGEEDQVIDTNAIGIKLTPIFGISIPVIVRIGTSPSTISLAELSIEKKEDNTDWLKMSFQRRGEQSMYGDLVAEFTSNDGITYSVGLVRGIGIYTPNETRNFSFQLNKPEGIELKNGKLTLKFISANESKPEIYAQSVLNL